VVYINTVISILFLSYITVVLFDKQTCVFLWLGLETAETLSIQCTKKNITARGFAKQTPEIVLFDVEIKPTTCISVCVRREIRRTELM